MGENRLKRWKRQKQSLWLRYKTEHVLGQHTKEEDHGKEKKRWEEVLR